MKPYFDTHSAGVFLLLGLLAWLGLHRDLGRGARGPGPVGRRGDAGERSSRPHDPELVDRARLARGNSSLTGVRTKVHQARPRQLVMQCEPPSGNHA